jgi:phosphohistidine phosphatase SixA
MWVPIRSVVAAAAAAALLAPAARAADPAARQALAPKLVGAALVEALRAGGLTILMRHMATDAVTPDPAALDVADCATQRNLSERGRQQAAEIRAAVAKLGIRISRVVSSPFCRCLETARLAFDRSEVSENLSVGDELSFAEKHARGLEVRKLLATAPEPGTDVVLITHTGTLLYSFGLETRPEGVAHVFRPGPAGTSMYLGSLAPEDWSRYAAELGGGGMPAPARPPAAKP